MPVKRGDIFWVNLDPVKGSEQAGKRPVIVIQNNVGNALASTTIIAPLTTKIFSKEYPTNVMVLKGTAGLKENSTILFSQIRVIDQSRLEKKIGVLPSTYTHRVDTAIKNSLGVH